MNRTTTTTSQAAFMTSPNTATKILAPPSRAKELSAFLQTLPVVQHAFAYGSGIFQQKGLYESGGRGKGPMLDFIVAVEDPLKWHEQVTCNAEKLGAGVHFNAAVLWQDKVVKYGVIGKDALCRDLTQWDTLYAAGRLQKPVLTLQADEDVTKANRQNLCSALIASLLLLPKTFSEKDLWRMIVGLSYLGDIRMGLAEDSRKVDRIASSSSQGLQDAYLPLLEGEDLGSTADLRRATDGQWECSTNLQASCQLISRLPREVKLRMGQLLGVDSVGDNNSIAEKAVSSGRQQQLIRSAIASIVASSSRGQAIAGLFMAGPGRSTWYVWEKLKKKLAS